MKVHFSNTFENSLCWHSKCNICYNGKELIPILELTTITIYKQWSNVYLKARKKISDDKYEFYTKYNR